MTDEEKEGIASLMLKTLRTIASGKKDYGNDVADLTECREIAKKTLREIGC